jgi:hypothetical protein
MADRASTRPEIDEEFLEQLRNDPDVIVHYRKTTDPFVPQLRLTAPIDVLWLIGRRDDDEVEPSVSSRHRRVIEVCRPKDGWPWRIKH